MYPRHLHCPNELENALKLYVAVEVAYENYETTPVSGREEIIYAELDMQKISMSRMEFDVCG